MSTNSSSTLLRKISASSDISEMMNWPIDFNVTNQIDDSWFTLLPNSSKQSIAQDGTGGIYALVGDGDGEDRSVLFVSSEGQTGLIAATLAEALQLIIALPYWRDCLKFSGGGNLEEMQRVVPYLEKDIHEDTPDIDTIRNKLFKELNLIKPVNALAKLHNQLVEASSSFQILGEDDSAFTNLLGRFVIEDNPQWQQRTS